MTLYKHLGPGSMTSLTNSYLASSPTQETAKNPAEGMMAQAFSIFDNAVDSILKKFAEQQGFDLAKSSNYTRRFNEGYFRVIYPVIVMYMVWLDEEKQQKALDNIGKIFSAMIFGVAGYQILDSNLDEGQTNPSEVLLCLSFMQECDKLMLDSFGLDATLYETLHRFKLLYLAAEIKEKNARFKESPYTKDHPEDCGYKAVHGYLPFFFLLQKTGKQDQIDEYLQLFYEWGAPLQIMDDLMDLEEDIAHGHYSYPTLGFEKEIAELSPKEAAARIHSDTQHIKQLQAICRKLISSSRKRSTKLNAVLFDYFIDILDQRLETFFNATVGDTKS